MKIDILASAAALSDVALLARLELLAQRERTTSVELLAHLAALDARPSLYAAQGYGTLFSYCAEGLRFSEDVACNRILVARTCRRYPALLDLLASGAMTLSSIRLIAPHLTPENHVVVLEKAAGRSLKAMEELVAELAPRPDVPTSVEKLPTPLLELPTPDGEPVMAEKSAAPDRNVVKPTAPARYRVQFTIGERTHDKLRRLQGLLRREIPNGDPATIVDLALGLLLEKVEKAKFAATAEPRPSRSIRRATDETTTPKAPSRHIPSEVKRSVWRRDAAQCAFVSPGGRRCTQTVFLEFHHVQPYANGGPATVANIALRCRRHNQYEADLVFGAPERALADAGGRHEVTPAGALRQYTRS
jgi:5-methylcytosine-specific restriction endonuclease McrA